MKSLTVIIFICLLMILSGVAIGSIIALDRRLAAQEADIVTLKKEWTAWRSRAFLHEKYFIESVNGENEKNHKK